MESKVLRCSWSAADIIGILSMLLNLFMHRMKYMHINTHAYCMYVNQFHRIRVHEDRYPVHTAELGRRPDHHMHHLLR